MVRETRNFHQISQILFYELDKSIENNLTVFGQYKG